jgi:lipoprotein-anchoring transpeptidase ErfK/SrfK
MVFSFYNDHIKSNFSDAPNWSHKSIYQYIFRNYDRQAAEAIHAVNHTIEFLRQQLGSRKESGKVRVQSENVKLLLAATKVHASLLDAKRKREQR